MLEKASKSERMRLQGLLAQAKGVQSTDLAEIATLVGQAEFAPRDEEVLLDTVADLVTCAPTTTTSASSKTALQDFESFSNFLTADVWERIANGDMQAIVNFLLRLGLRFPTEPTSRTVAVVFLAYSEGVEAVQAMDAAARLTTIRVFKKMIKDAAKTAVPLLETIKVLPKTPLEVQRQNSVAYDMVYAEQEPQSCPIAAVVIEELKLTTRMRATSRLASSVGLGTSPLAVQPMQQFMVRGQATMQQMGMMQQSIASLQGGSMPTITMTRQQSGSFDPPLKARVPQQRAGLPAVAQQLQMQGSAAPEAHEVATPAAVKVSLRADAKPLDEEDEKDCLLTLPKIPASKKVKIAAAKSVAEATAEIMTALDVVKSKGAAKAKANALKDSKGGKGISASKGIATIKGKAKHAKAEKHLPTDSPKCRLDHEASRSQYLVRFGAGVTSKNFAYDGTEKGKHKALKEAKVWSQKRCKELGIEVPAKLR